ncbi:unnamed protein product [Rotaria magnacalcarata]|uniref:Glycoprotein hormone subunit beta domain-containing protein n=1 Tax=Rotaria magnacalcarata TaxID=392030 RepID=A0A816V5X2_9BILA|nr:unnamed protein product [Rotaria magnacalcarata]CAF2103743.1 unnamed protein product [Rotaria magnacalcarata]CAF2116113.1 unnamed protein product [Rotaria magnacalcarata]CAF2242292.1 unnamed protein product [Rotaria magnacalcarata]CAF3771991.1 unnamed protein product [Rotaria magnacalcarata]
MTSIIFTRLFILLIGIQLKMASAHGNSHHICKLENRTIVFNVCKIQPRITLPVCTGYCSSSTHWSFHSKRFVHSTTACTVTDHRTEIFVCPDSTHTAIQLMIPVNCSCAKSSCRRYHR